MIKIILSFVCFFILVIVEFSFLNSLPWPPFFVPLIFVCGLYLFQHLGLNFVLWWLPALGLYLDFWRLGLVFGETFFYSVTALGAIFLGQRFFTNRSFYGVFGNTILSLWILNFLHFVWFFLVNFNSDFSLPWFKLLTFIFWQTFFAGLLVGLLFWSGNRIKGVLNKFFNL